jgi:hypothetical protein
MLKTKLYLLWEYFIKQCRRESYKSYRIHVVCGHSLDKVYICQLKVNTLDTKEEWWFKGPLGKEYNDLSHLTPIFWPMK